MIDNIKTIGQLKRKLLSVYSIDTVRDDYKIGWSNCNPTYGQCAVTSLLVRELFGGEIYKLEKEKYYNNLINDEVIDLTKERFEYNLDYSKGIKRTKPFDEETIKRYDKLKIMLNDSK